MVGADTEKVGAIQDGGMEFDGGTHFAGNFGRRGSRIATRSRHDANAVDDYNHVRHFIRFLTVESKVASQRDFGLWAEVEETAGTEVFVLFDCPNLTEPIDDKSAAVESVWPV